MSIVYGVWYVDWGVIDIILILSRRIALRISRRENNNMPYKFSGRSQRMPAEGKQQWHRRWRNAKCKQRTKQIEWRMENIYSLLFMRDACEQSWICRDRDTSHITHHTSHRSDRHSAFGWTMNIFWHEENKTKKLTFSFSGFCVDVVSVVDFAMWDRDSSFRRWYGTP